MRFRHLQAALATLVIILAGHATSIGQVATQDSRPVSIVMSGLENPRGLAFAPDGSLHVVEAGRGGTTCALHRNQRMCFGLTGALTRLRDGAQERVAVGFPSYISPGGEVTGAHDVSFLGLGGAYVTVGYGGDPDQRGVFGPHGQLLGTLLHVAASGQWRPVADVAAHERRENPAGDRIDANPYGLLAEPGARLVCDAGANALIEVGANGDTTTVATFPSRPSRSTDAVPTAVVKGPDGAYYVSELTGVPFAAGAASVYRVVHGEPAQIHVAGLKTVIDLEFGLDGSLYVLQYATGPVFFAGPGEIVRIAPNGDRTVVITNLQAPTSLVVGPDGALYVTNRGTSIGAGEVLRFDF